MIKSNFATPQERKAFEQGFQAGEKEGLRKIGLLAQLLVNDTASFTDAILRGSEGEVNLVEIFMGMGD